MIFFYRVRTSIIETSLPSLHSHYVIVTSMEVIKKRNCMFKYCLVKSLLAQRHGAKRVAADVLGD